MITLFEPNETNFTHNGLGNLDKNIIDPVVEEDLNGLFSLSFRYPLFALHGLEIDGQSIVRSPVPNGPDQLFRVYKPVKSMGYLEVFCYHIFYDLVDNFVEDTNIVGKNGQEALTQLGSRTQYAHNFRFFSDITTIAGSRVVRKNPVSFLLDDNLDNSFVNRWGGELKRDNFDVFMYNAIGSDKGVTIRHKKDLLGYEAVVDWSTVVTRIMPIGFDGLLLPEKYVDSPVINSYVKPKIQIIEYSDVKAAVGQYADDKDAIPIEQAYKELRKLAKLEYEKGKIDYPEASYKVEFATLSETEEYKDYKELETVKLGDTVTVNHDEDNLNIKAKVIHYRFDPLAKKYINIELGNYRETFSDLQGKIDSIYNRVEEVKQDLSLTIQISANGKNKNFRGPNEPKTGMREGDLWYQPVGEGEVMLHRFDGAYWKLEKVSAGLLGGTLDAENGDVNLINLNASAIVTGTLASIRIQNDFARTGGITGSIVIDSDIRMSATDGSGFLLSERRLSFSDGEYETILKKDGLDFYRGGVKQLGQRFFTFEDGTSGIRFESQHIGERALSIRGNQLLSHDGQGGRERESHLYLSPAGGGSVVAGDATGARSVMRARSFHLNRGVGMTTYDTGLANMRIYSEGFIWHWATSPDTHNPMFRMDADAFRMYKNLDMTGRQVLNTSDRRMKRDIKPTEIKGRETIRSYNFVDYFYTGEDYPDEKQFGLIAQDTPIIGAEGEDGNWTISTTKQVMLNSLVSKEIDEELVEVSKIVKEQKEELKAVKQELADLKALLIDKGVI